MSELKTCPFCGIAMRVEQYPKIGKARVEMRKMAYHPGGKNCILGGMVFDIKKWNTLPESTTLCQPSGDSDSQPSDTLSNTTQYMKESSEEVEITDCIDEDDQPYIDIIKEAYETISEWGIDGDDYIGANVKYFEVCGDSADNSFELCKYFDKQLQVIVDLGLKEAKRMMDNQPWTAEAPTQEGAEIFMGDDSVKGMLVHDSDGLEGEIISKGFIASKNNKPFINIVDKDGSVWSYEGKMILSLRQGPIKPSE